MPRRKQSGVRAPVVIVNGGASPVLEVAPLLPVDAYVIAVDSGYAAASLLGLRVHTLIGDFDSIDPESITNAKALGINVIEYPTDKDATDLELAIDLAITRQPTEIVVVGGGAGERVDHFQAAIALLSDPRYGHFRISAWFGRSRFVIVRAKQPAILDYVHGLSVPGESNAVVTLIPITLSAEGVTTTGLRYALHAETMFRHRTRGVSNTFSDAASSATVEVASGTLLVIQPFAIPLSPPSRQDQSR